MLLRLFEWLDANLPGTLYLRDATYGFTILLTSHVVVMCLFLGLIIMMDLRLAGLGNLHTPVSQMQKRLFPWQILGFALTSITGILLLYSDPLRYYPKGFFWAKMGVMALAGLNALAFHVTTYRSVAAWDTKAATPAGARVAGVLSLVLWACVLVFGRLVAYDWWTYEMF
jgi:hypothetical protein